MPRAAERACSTVELRAFKQARRDSNPQQCTPSFMHRSLNAEIRTRIDWSRTSHSTRLSYIQKEERQQKERRPCALRHRVRVGVVLASICLRAACGSCTRGSLVTSEGAPLQSEGGVVDRQESGRHETAWPASRAGSVVRDSSSRVRATTGNRTRIPRVALSNSTVEPLSQSHSAARAPHRATAETCTRRFLRTGEAPRSLGFGGKNVRSAARGYGDFVL